MTESLIKKIRKIAESYGKITEDLDRKLREEEEKIKKQQTGKTHGETK